MTRSSARAAASTAADAIAETLRALEAPALALPTGATMVPVYQALVARHQAGQADFARVTGFSLDEFAGLPPDHPGSCRAFLRAHLFSHVNLAPARTHVLRGDARNWRTEIVRFERLLVDLGGLDLAILGIGLNGHLAINEPAAALVAGMHRVRLAASTRRAFAASVAGRFRDAPTHGLTMGIGTILSARRVLLVATGPHKADIIQRALSGPITTRVPASLLQAHPSVLVLLDRHAAARLPRVSRARTSGPPVDPGRAID